MIEELVRIFLGEAGWAGLAMLAEIVLRTVVMYLYTMLLARMVGQGGVGQLGPFEFVLVIAVGSAAGDPMFYPDVPLLHGILVITVVILLHRITGYLLGRNRRLEAAVEGEPVMLVHEGEVREDAVEASSITRRELMMLLRERGIREVGEVQRAYLEPSGSLSVFKHENGGAAGSGEPTWPEYHRA